MATTLNTIYPPQVDTFMPSFLYNESAKIWFNVSSYNEDKIGLIEYIHVSMVDQRNNENVFAGTSNGTTVYPQYYPINFIGEKNNNNDLDNKMGYDPDKKMYWLVIPPQILKTNLYNFNQYYKIQLRFDLTTSENPTDFFKIENDNITANALGLALYTSTNQDNFSEWSTGTLIKPILIPKLSIQKFKTNERVEINPSTNIKIAGNINFYKIGDTNPYKNNTEELSWYQIEILNNEKTNKIFNSNKIYTNSNNGLNYLIDMSQLIPESNYQMRIIYETSHGYHEEIDYPIRIKDYDSSTTTLRYTLNKDEEKGTINLYMEQSNLYTNSYIIIRRSSYYSNFMDWNLIAIYEASKLENGINFIDDTIESMVGYRYQLQIVSNSGDIVYRPLETEIIHCDFYGGLFSDKNKRLNISFDFQLSNVTNAMNRTKIDTLGGQYPLFTQNAKLKYHTYNITGRISTEDNGELFLPKEEVFGSISDENSYYNYRYNPSVISPHTAECMTINPHQDWLYEREYRNAVEEWLNNGKPKLFRSMTEGNIIVMLDGITMTPDTVLGRRLYNFSATMYEIGNGKDINSIASFGLFDIVDERL